MTCLDHLVREPQGTQDAFEPVLKPQQRQAGFALASAHPGRKAAAKQTMKHSDVSSAY